MTRTLKRFLLVLLASAVLGACTKPSPAPEKLEVALARRAELRWQHLMAGRWHEAYELLTPGYRKATSEEAYRATFYVNQLRWISARTERVECDGDDVCTVLVAVEFELLGGMPGVSVVKSTQSIVEKWLRSGGNWYILPPQAG